MIKVNGRVVGTNSGTGRGLLGSKRKQQEAAGKLFAATGPVVETLEVRQLLSAGDHFYSQRDPSWSGNHMGTTTDTIGNYGCAITSVAILLHWESGSSSDPNPGQFNTWLTNNGGYTDGDLLIWSVADDYDGTGGLTWIGSTTGTDEWSQIDSELAAGRKPIVKVDFYPSTTAIDNHFVVVYEKTGASGTPSSYKILDPWDTTFNANKTLATYYKQSSDSTTLGMRKYGGTFPGGTVTPGTPVTIAPGDTTGPGPELTDLTPKFEWNAAANATRYELNLLNVDTGTFILDEFSISGGATTSYTLTSDLPAGTRFKWDMRAFNGSVPSGYATDRYFRTAGAPTAPVTISPGDTSSPGPEISDLTPEFTWNTSATATRYELNLFNVDTGTYVLDEFAINGGSTTSYILTSNLPAGNRFVWDMRAFNGDVPSGYAANRYFRTAATPGTPVTIAPGDTTGPGPEVTDLTPKFEWNAAANATRYELNLLNVDTGTFVLDEFSISGGATTSYTLTSDLPAGTRFKWDMRAFNGSVPSGYATDRYFRTAPAGSPTWTVLIYLDGDNSLESAANEDFGEMAQISNPNVNIVVQFDRRAGSDWATTKRFLLSQGMTPTPSNALSDMGELNMGDPSTLQNFINWGRTTYPADHYALILWDHGGGWLDGVAEDNGDWLTMAELHQAVGAVTNGGANKLDVVAFDACLMGELEVAYEIKDYASFFVGSADLEDGDGYEYQDILAPANLANGTTAENWAQYLVNSFGTRYEPNNGDDTMAAGSLSQIGSVSSALSGLADLLRNNIDTERANISAAWTAARKYTADPVHVGSETYRAYIDLHDFAMQVRSRTSNVAIQNQALAVMNAVASDFLRAYWKDAGFAGTTTGQRSFSIYFPANDTGARYTDYDAAHLSFIADTSQRWDEFLESYFNSSPSVGSLSDAPDPVVRGQNLSLTANSVTDSDGTVSKVEFYLDSNGNGSLDVGTDQLLGSDSSSSGGWTWSGATTGFPVGAVRYFGRAQDNDLSWSAVVSTIGTVQDAPSALPEITVSGKGWDIADNDTTPTNEDGTHFRSHAVGDVMMERTFRVSNPGAGALNVTALSLPQGYTILDPITSPIAPGGYSEFRVGLYTSTAGVFSGDIVLTTNDTDEGTFNFAVTGTIWGGGDDYPNADQWGSAQVIALSGSTGQGTIAGSVEVGTDTDLFKFVPAGSGRVDVTVSPASAFDVTFRVYDSTYNLLTYNDVGYEGQPEHSYFSVVGGQTYFVMTSSSVQEAGAYTIVVDSPLAAPEIAVTGNGQDIADNDTTPSTTDNTDFGSAAQNGSAISKTFRVTNTGTAALTLNPPTLPGGYTLTESLNTSIAAGGYDDFTVTLATTAVGTFAGQISIVNNDSDENPFNFAISGTVIDATAPSVTAGAFVYWTNPHTITIIFSENVSASLGTSDLGVQPLAGGSAIAPMSVSFDVPSNTATFTFDSTLDNGNYRVTLWAAGVSDAAGNALAINYAFDFFVLKGDANRDRSVGFVDLVVVAQNYNTSSGATWATGDFDGDGAVSFSDLVAVAQNYGTTLAAPASVPNSPSGGGDAVTLPDAPSAAASIEPSPVAAPAEVTAAALPQSESPPLVSAGAVAATSAVSVASSASASAVSVAPPSAGIWPGRTCVSPFRRGAGVAIGASAAVGRQDSSNSKAARKVNLPRPQANAMLAPRVALFSSRPIRRLDELLAI